jgi:hypothetical protein
VPGTAEPPGSAEPAGAAGPLGPVGLAQLQASSLECPYSLKKNLDECDSLKKRRFDQRV